MDCASEESEIRRALEPVAGIQSLSFQLGARTLAIRAPAAVVAEAVAALRKAGFDPQPLDTAASPPRQPVSTQPMVFRADWSAWCSR